jgi:hypothetical protein
LIVVPTFLSEASPEGDNWRVEVELAKTSFISLEPIWLDITLTNASADTQRTDGLEGPNHRRFYIFLFDSHGDSVEYTGVQINYAVGPGRLLLEPGEQDYGSFDLTELFFSHEVKSGYSVDDWRFQYIPKGKYAVHAWFDGVISNQLTFEIVEPYGYEVKALELMEEALTSSSWNEPGPSAPVYRQVVKRFPESAFAEMCYYLSVLYSHWAELKEGTRHKKFLKKAMLEKYPNSGHSGSWIRALTYDEEDEEKLVILEELLQKYPNTRCYKYAEQMKIRLLKNIPE